MADSRFADFSNLHLDEFPEEQTKKEERKPSKLIRPGLYEDIPIFDIVENGMSEKDPTWIKYTVKFKVGTGEIHHYIQVPTKSLFFGEKKSDRPFKTLQSFTRSLGMELTKENTSIVLGLFFKDVERLIGMRLNLVLAHDAYYASPVNRKIIILSREDKPLLSEDGVNPIQFDDFQAAEIYCNTKELQFSKFVKVRFTNYPKTKNDLSVLEKPLKKKERPSCPF